MRFFIGVIDVSTGTADAGEMAAIDAFNASLRDAGHWVMAAGLAAPAQSTVIDARGAEPVIRSGPVADTADYVAGFWIIEATDRDAALALATEGSRACNRRVELRPFL